MDDPARRSLLPARRTSNGARTAANRIDPDCPECDGTGLIIYRACPRCGDLGWAYRNGRNDQAGMICQLGCGYAWTATDPGWAIQQRPAAP